MWDASDADRLRPALHRVKLRGRVPEPRSSHSAHLPTDLVTVGQPLTHEVPESMAPASGWRSTSWRDRLLDIAADCGGTDVEFTPAP
ncbi:hypothetical protein [Streptomyces sp. NPDC085665]|uniref:hypothetical protein n=1 Tax=Streptomyces sp. NPDC085665 TaxID=3365735 RepID=UPI0037D299CB